MPGTNTPPKAARKQSERARPHEVHQDRRAGHDQRGRASHGAQERERNCQPKGHRQARQRKGVIHPTTLRLKTVIATRNLEAAQRLGLKPNCFLYCTARKCNFRVRNEPELTEQSQKNKSDQRCKMKLPRTVLGVAWEARIGGALGAGNHKASEVLRISGGSVYCQPGSLSAPRRLCDIPISCIHIGTRLI
jgi:hypothetical protein